MSHTTPLFLMVILPQVIFATRRLPTLPVQKAIMLPLATSNLETNYDEAFKVPGASPAYHCSDPAEDIFQITSMMFRPTNPRVGFYEDIHHTGHFKAPTGEVPWLYITGSINGREELGPMYDSPLCDLDIFQDITVPNPIGDRVPNFGFHRSCPPAIEKGYARIATPPMPLHPFMVPIGEWKVRVEATTQKGERIFCVQGALNITT